MIIKTAPDKEKVKSILNLLKEREDFVKSINHEKFSTNVTENYYEIIKRTCKRINFIRWIKSYWRICSQGFNRLSSKL